MSITTDNILSVLPAVLAEDESINALATSIAEALSARMEEIERAGIYTRIDKADEALLDILAYDFKVDWWDSEFDIQKKRETLKSSWYVHKHMATPAAVKTALSAMCRGADCEEWFEYGGEPYHFRISMYLDAEDILVASYDKVFTLLRFYKNLRSVLDHILFIVSTDIGGTISIGSNVGHGCMITELREGESVTELSCAVHMVGGQLSVMETALI